MAIEPRRRSKYLEHFMKNRKLNENDAEKAVEQMEELIKGANPLDVEEALHEVEVSLGLKQTPTASPAASVVGTFDQQINKARKDAYDEWLAAGDSAAADKRFVRKLRNTGIGSYDQYTKHFNASPRLKPLFDEEISDFQANNVTAAAKKQADIATARAGDRFDIGKFLNQHSLDKVKDEISDSEWISLSSKINKHKEQYRAAVSKHSGGNQDAELKSLVKTMATDKELLNGLDTIDKKAHYFALQEVYNDTQAAKREQQSNRSTRSAQAAGHVEDQIQHQQAASQSGSQRLAYKSKLWFPKQVEGFDHREPHELDNARKKKIVKLFNEYSKLDDDGLIKTSDQMWEEWKPYQGADVEHKRLPPPDYYDKFRARGAITKMRQDGFSREQALEWALRDGNAPIATSETSEIVGKNIAVTPRASPTVQSGNGDSDMGKKIKHTKKETVSPEAKPAKPAKAPNANRPSTSALQAADTARQLREAAGFDPERAAMMKRYLEMSQAAGAIRMTPEGIPGVIGELGSASVPKMFIDTGAVPPPPMATEGRPGKLAMADRPLLKWLENRGTPHTLGSIPPSIEPPLTTPDYAKEHLLNQSRSLLFANPPESRLPIYPGGPPNPPDEPPGLRSIFSRSFTMPGTMYSREPLPQIWDRGLREFVASLPDDVSPNGHYTQAQYEQALAETVRESGRPTSIHGDESIWTRHILPEDIQALREWLRARSVPGTGTNIGGMTDYMSDMVHGAGNAARSGWGTFARVAPNFAAPLESIGGAAMKAGGALGSGLMAAGRLGSKFLGPLATIDMLSRDLGYSPVGHALEAMTGSEGNGSVDPSSGFLHREADLLGNAFTNPNMPLNERLDAVARGLINPITFHGLESTRDWLTTYPEQDVLTQRTKSRMRERPMGATPTASGLTGDPNTTYGHMPESPHAELFGAAQRGLHSARAVQDLVMAHTNNKAMADMEYDKQVRQLTHDLASRFGAENVLMAYDAVSGHQFSPEYSAGHGPSFYPTLTDNFSDLRRSFGGY